MTDDYYNPPDYDCKGFEGFVCDRKRELLAGEFNPFTKEHMGDALDDLLGKDFDSFKDMCEQKEWEKIGRWFYFTVYNYWERQAENRAAEDYNERLIGADHENF